MVLQNYRSRPMGHMASSKVRIDADGMVCGHGTEGGYDIDEEIAVRVFGMDRELVQAWIWEIPGFSSDRRHAASVVQQMLSKPEDVRSRFEALLASHVKRASSGASISEAIVVLTPDVICECAIKSL